MAFRVVRLGSPREKNEGLRIGTVRRPPRGVPKALFAEENWFDVWLPELAPSDEAFAIARAAKTPQDWANFAKLYRAEMSTPEKQRLLKLLAEFSARTMFSVGCYCEDESHCHRSVLRALLEEAGAYPPDPVPRFRLPVRACTPGDSKKNWRIHHPESKKGGLVPPPFLKGYSGQSTDELLALQDNYRVDSIVLAFEEALLHKAVRELTREEQYVLAVEALEREVNNGGYLQFFTHAGEHAATVESALRAIDCPVIAQITREALASLELEDDFSPDDVAAAAENADESVREVLEECDNRYFDDGEPVAERLFDWIRKNRKSIRVG